MRLLGDLAIIAVVSLTAYLLARGLIEGMYHYARWKARQRGA